MISWEGAHEVHIDSIHCVAAKNKLSRTSFLLIHANARGVDCRLDKPPFLLQLPLVRVAISSKFSPF